MKLTDQEMLRAFAISKDSMLWRGIMQRLSDRRETSLSAAVGHISANNPLASAGEIIAQDTIQDIIQDFETLRESATKD